MPDCPETQYCLEIQVISTVDGGTAPLSCKGANYVDVSSKGVRCLGV